MVTLLINKKVHSISVDLLNVCGTSFKILRVLLFLIPVAQIIFSFLDDTSSVISTTSVSAIKILNTLWIQVNMDFAEMCSMAVVVKIV